MTNGDNEEARGVGALSYEDLTALNDVHEVLIGKLIGQPISPSGKIQLRNGRELFKKMFKTAIYLEKKGTIFGMGEPDDKGKCLYSFAIDSIVNDDLLREHINHNYPIGKGFTSFFREVYRELLDAEDNVKTDRKKLEKILDFIGDLNLTLSSTLNKTRSTAFAGY